MELPCKNKEPPERESGGVEGRMVISLRRDLVGTLLLLAAERFDPEAHFLGQRSADEAAHGVRLPGGQFHNLGERGSRRPAHQVQGRGSWCRTRRMGSNSIPSGSILTDDASHHDNVRQPVTSPATEPANLPITKLRADGDRGFETQELGVDTHVTQASLWFGTKSSLVANSRTIHLRRRNSNSVIKKSASAAMKSATPSVHPKPATSA